MRLKETRRFDGRIYKLTIMRTSKEELANIGKFTVGKNYDAVFLEEYTFKDRYNTAKYYRVIKIDGGYALYLS